MTPKTKADLMETISHNLEVFKTSLDAKNEELATIQAKLRDAENEARRSGLDAKRLSANAADAEGRLSAIRQVIEASLKTKHNVGTRPLTEYVRGANVVVDADNEDIRLLRHLHGLTADDRPF